MHAYTRILAAAAALLIALATGLGAWASHALDGVLPTAALRSLQTAIDYQFFHALGLLVLTLTASRRNPSRTLLTAMTAVVIGTLAFCGGVYASSLDGPAIVARIAPAGGVLLIAGWLGVGIALLAAEDAESV